MLVIVSVLGGTVVWGAEQSLTVSPNQSLVPINSEKYYIFGNESLRNYYINRWYTPARLNPIAPIQPLVPYNHRFGAEVITVGNGMGVYPAYFQRIANGLFFQIRTGMLTLSHSLANLRYNNAFATNLMGTTFIMPIYGGLQKYFYVGKISKRLVPYITTGVGPVFGLNFPGFRGNYSQRKLPTAFRVGPAAFLGAGATFMFSPKYWITFESKYDVIYFPAKLGPWNNYSGPAFSVGISRGFYF